MTNLAGDYNYWLVEPKKKIVTMSTLSNTYVFSVKIDKPLNLLKSRRKLQEFWGLPHYVKEEAIKIIDLLFKTLFPDQQPKVCKKSSKHYCTNCDACRYLLE